MKIEPFYKKLGKLITKRRIEIGMSHGILAHEIGMSRTAIINMEAGRQRILVHKALLIDKALGYPPGYLISKAVR